MKKRKERILLVEDDRNFGFVCKELLEENGYTVVWRHDGVQGWEAFTSEPFDICILDVTMPEMDGLTLVRQIRSRNNLVPVIFLTARVQQDDILKGFKAGADDYILKPFNTEELLLRLEALFRRARTSYIADEQSSKFMFNGYEFNSLNQRLITPTGEQIKMTRKESALLHLFCVNLNKTVRREVALNAIWGDNDYFMGRSMDVYIVRLRRLIKNVPGLNLVNIHGQGFRLEYKSQDDSQQVQTAE